MLAKLENTDRGDEAYRYLTQCVQAQRAAVKSQEGGEKSSPPVPAPTQETAPPSFDALIPIGQGNIGSWDVNTVNARDLWRGLGVNTRFDDWIRYRLKQRTFQKNKDYVVILKHQENPMGGRPSKEYHLSLPMAKKLAMMENTPRGDEVRDYFLKCEEERIMNLDLGAFAMSLSPGRKTN